VQRLSIKYRATIGYVAVAVAVAQELSELEKSGICRKPHAKAKIQKPLAKQGRL